MKKVVAMLMLAALAIGLCACGSAGDQETDISVSAEAETENTLAETTFCMEKLHSGDAKFYDSEHIITSVDGVLCLYGLDGSVKSYEIASNWIDCIGSEGVVVYANGNYQTGMARLDGEGNLLSNTLLWTSEKLCIDPAVIKLGETYWMTVTQIDGEVNNADPQTENGIYTIQLYRSENLETWEYAADVVTKQNNLEDVKLMEHNGHLAIVYEEETVDKGNSAIYLKEALDESCTSWGEATLLVASDADNEPAGILENPDGGYLLYYSSDKANLGESYMGGELYELTLDADFNPDGIGRQIACDVDKGILLYDVVREDGSILYLVTLDYLTDCDLAVLTGK